MPAALSGTSKLPKYRMPITKRPCSNCPFRNDGKAIELRDGRLRSIVEVLLADDRETFVCHKTLSKDRKTCAGAVGIMSRLGRLPVIARLGLSLGVITHDDIATSASMVVDPDGLMGCSAPARSDVLANK